MNKKLALLSMSLLVASAAAAQTSPATHQNAATAGQTQQKVGQVIGHVSDPDGQPVARAAVKIGERIVAVTDKNGNFTLRNLPAGARSVTISYIGMKSVRASISSTMNIAMEWDNANLDEVMVVAYGTAKKSSFTGSAATIKADEVGKLQVTNAAEALKGRVAGVQFYNNTGAPDGGDPQIRIRGISSINAGNSPLIIVDGAPYPGALSSLNTQDIETFSVLKDAASAALYGARGANGVIIITTKRTKSNHGARINFDAKWGVNQVAQQRYNTLRTPAEYYEAYHQGLRNESMYKGLTADNNYQLGDAAEAYDYANKRLQRRLKYITYTVPEGQQLVLENGRLNPAASLGNVVEGLDADGNAARYMLLPDDWYEAAYRPALRQEYNVTVAKGGDHSNLYFSAGHLDNQGIMKHTDFRRFTSRLKADWEAAEWLKLNANISFTNSKSNAVEGDGDERGSGSIFAFVNNIAPIYPIYLRDANGQILRDRQGFTRYDYGTEQVLPWERPYMAMGNPLGDNELNHHGKRVNTFTANFGTDFNLGRGFKFVTNNTYYYINARETYLANPYYGQAALSGKGEVSVVNNEDVRSNFQQLLTFNRTFSGIHQVEALAGHEYYRSSGYELSGSRSNIADNKNHELDAGIVNGTPGSNERLYNTEGWFARANYSLLERYFASASFRRDASSRFHPDHQWGNFWSLSGAWMLSKESFFNAKWVDELKVKASYGEQGNDGISDYYYTNIYKFKNASGHMALVADQLGNEHISWEKNSNFNLGVEFSLWKGRLSGQVEYFQRTTHDMLSTYNLPRSNSFPYYMANLGNMTNRGVELELNAALIQTSKFQWSVGLNLTHYKNEITAIPEANKQKDYEGHRGYESGGYFYGEGLPMWTRVLKRTAGVDERTGKMTYYVWANRYDYTKPVPQKDASGNVVMGTDGKPVQARDSWGELVYEYAQVPQVDAQGRPVLDKDGKPVTSTVADRLTKTTTASEASYFLAKSPHPDLYGGFNTRLSYAGFDLGVDFSFQLGGYILDSDYASLMYGFSGGYEGQQLHRDALSQSWTPTNRQAKYARFEAGTRLESNVTTNADLFLTSASFLSLNNINLGYTLPTSVLHQWSKGAVKNLRVYVSADNICYWSARKGFDPRQAINETKAVQYSPVRTISGGFTLTF